MADKTGQPTFNIGDLFDEIATAIPERPALVWSDDCLSYGELADRSDRLANTLLKHGVKRGDRVGFYLHNCTAYIVGLLATFKIGAIYFNINYRYVADELNQIVADAGARALVHGAEFADSVSLLRKQCPNLAVTVSVYQPEDPRPDTDDSIDYDYATSGEIDHEAISSGRSGDDQLLIYTGGTTGQPKGVLWTQEDLFFAALGGGGQMHPEGPITKPEQIGERAKSSPPVAILATSPLMHGAAMWGSLIALLGGLKLVLTDTHKFDAEAIWGLVESERITALSTTGDAMAAPLLEALEANPGRWSLDSLMVKSWGGAPMTESFRNRFRDHFPHIQLLSGLGSTESGQSGSGNLDTGGDGFMIMAPREDLAVIKDDRNMAEPGEMGIMARTGHLPQGYWNDPEKTAETFIMVDGKRWVLTGDSAKLEPDGSLRLYGRDSNTINSGGEKIFAEEVEEVVRSHPSVRDAVVTSVAHERWGQAVVAIAETTGDDDLELEDLRMFCGEKLARYKLPKRLVVVEQIPRTPVGKAKMEEIRHLAKT